MTQTPSVLAVLTTKADSAYCERTLASLFAQSVLPTRLVIGVVGENASSIRTYCESSDIPFPYTICTLGKPATFFEAVNFLVGEYGKDEEWLWLLHDDSAPEEHCLERLVESANEKTSADDGMPVGVVGVKQVAWDNPNKLLEVGIRATRSARRVPYIGHGEYDQGQYDVRRDVLAVGSAGMLINRQALDTVGGLEERLGPFGDGLELSKRMRAGGYGVLVSPHAKVRHAQQSLGEDDRQSFASRRTAQIFNSLTSTRTFSFPILALTYLLLAIPRALTRLFTGEARLAWAEIYAPLAVIGSAGHLLRARKRFTVASTHAGSQSSASGISHEDTPHAIRTAKRERTSAYRDAASMEDVTDPLTEKALQQRRQSARSYGWFILALTGLATAIAHLPRFSAQVAGGALLPDSSSFTQGVRTAASPWLASGDGYSTSADIFWGFLTPFSLVTAHLGVTATWIVFFAIIAAGLSAHIAASEMTVSPPVRAVGALVWAFAPSLLDSVSAGHVAGALAHIVAPFAVMAYVRTWKGSLSALAASALLFAFLSTTSPMILLLTIIVALAGVIFRPGQRARWLILPIPSLVLLAPTLFSLTRLSFPSSSINTSPLSGLWRLLFSTPGMPVDTQVSALSILSFSPLNTTTLSQLASFDISALARIIPLAVIVAIAIVALLRTNNYRAIRLGWLFIALGWAWALLASSVPVGSLSTPGKYSVTYGWTGIALSCAFLGVWIVILNMAYVSTDEITKKTREEYLESTEKRVRTRIRSFVRSVVRAGVNSAVGTTALASLIVGAVWAGESFTGDASLLGPVQPQIPALALADEESENRSRVLVLHSDDNGFSGELWRGDGIELHETSMVASLIRADIAAASDKDTPYGKQANDDIAAAIASLSGDSSTVAETFLQHGISVVLVPETTADSASRTLIGRLNAISDLEYITDNETGSFWRVRTEDAMSLTASRVRLDAGRHSVAVPSGVFGVRAGVGELRSELETEFAEAHAEKTQPSEKQTQEKKSDSAKPAEKQSKETKTDADKTISPAEAKGGQAVTLPHRGRVTLAERADPLWHAELVSIKGTQTLPSVSDTWNQQWDIPLDELSADTELVIYYGSPLQRAWIYVQLTVVILCVIAALALPKRKRSYE